jgi:STAS domain-containing protein
VGQRKRIVATICRMFLAGRAVVHDEYDLREGRSTMEVDATPGALQLQFDSRFTVSDAKRLRDSVLALAPVARLTLDFTRVRELHDSAIAILAGTLKALPRTRIVVRGLSMHHWRLLRYFGIEQPALAM